MNYRIEQKKQLELYGYTSRFSGSPKARDYQDHNFVCNTRLKQAAIQYMAHDVDTTYCIMRNLSDEGYDFSIASYIGDDDIVDTFGQEVADWFEKIIIPAGTYLICEGERCEYPTNYVDDLYRNVVTDYLPSSGFELTEGPELEIIHWFYKEGDTTLNSSRYIELWLPVKKK